MLKYPYPRDVEEPNIYETATVHAELGRMYKVDGETGPPTHTISSKEGYLNKMCGIRRNWLRRWFVLFRDELRYFKKQGDKRPIRIIQLSDVIAISEDRSLGKSFVMKIVAPKRIFYVQASSDGEMGDWLYMLKWQQDVIQKQIN